MACFSHVITVLRNCNHTVRQSDFAETKKMWENNKLSNDNIHAAIRTLDREFAYIAHGAPWAS